MEKNSKFSFEKNRYFILSLLLGVAFLFSQGVDSAYARTPQMQEAEKPFVVEYYYKVKWGYADEFMRLFKKNHFPVLKKQIEAGRIQ